MALGLTPPAAWAGETLAPLADGALDSGGWVLASALLVLALGLWLLGRQQAAKLRQCRALLAERDAQAAAVQRQQAKVGACAQALLAARNGEALGQAVLSQLAPWLQLGAGLVAGWDAESGRLQPLAGYATEGAQLGEAIHLNQSLLLQCARSGQALEIAHEQAAALRIHSGLGWMQPRCLWLVPVRQGDLVCAVLELALARDLTEADRQLLRALEPVLALNLARLQASQAMQGVQGSGALLAAALQPAHAPLAMTLQRESGATLLASQRWADWLGTTASEAAQRPLRSFWADAAAHAELMRQLRRQGVIEAARVSLLHAQGHALHLRVRAWQGQLDGEALVLMVFERLGEGE